MSSAITRPRLPRPASLTSTPVEELVEEAHLVATSVNHGTLRILDVPQATIQQSSFMTVELAGADMTGLTAVDCRFDACDLSNTTISNARWTRVEATGCKLSGALLNQTLLQDVRFLECRADYAQLQSITSQRVAFEDCSLHHAFFNNADLRGVSFISCDLSKTDFSHAMLEGVDLRGSNLEDIVVTIDQLRGVTVTSDQALYLCGLVGLQIDDSAPSLG